jgi:hypothetical protein
VLLIEALLHHLAVSLRRPEDGVGKPPPSGSLYTSSTFNTAKGLPRSVRRILWE